LVVLGGSGGASTLNENVPRALYKVRTELAGWEIVHQSGEADLQQTRELYRKLSLQATVVAFLDQMPPVLAASSLAVCRAGGTTLAELAAAGVPALLVPYPHAAGNHQRQNADVFSSAGGSITLDQRELPGRLDDHLADALSRVLGDAAGRQRMSAAMRRLARPQAAAEVADLILQIVQRPSERVVPTAA
jgi:UDP-N-acetylglucosamine--N-acetylmuramyl-(pentapeptide) pyrophosphoryl-undecaprenol N-acetylglucosamine transferase